MAGRLSPHLGTQLPAARCRARRIEISRSQEHQAIGRNPMQSTATLSPTTPGGAGTQKRDLVFTRVFDAPIAQVWKAWSDPELIKKWWGPDRFACPLAKIDFRVGGTSLVCMLAPKEFGGQ